MYPKRIRTKGKVYANTSIVAPIVQNLGNPVVVRDGMNVSGILQVSGPATLEDDVQILGNVVIQGTLSASNQAIVRSSWNPQVNVSGMMGTATVHKSVGVYFQKDDLVWSFIDLDIELPSTATGVTLTLPTDHEVRDGSRSPLEWQVVSPQLSGFITANVDIDQGSTVLSIPLSYFAGRYTTRFSINYSIT